MANQTTGLGVAAKIAVPGNEIPIKTVPGYNNVQLSLTGINGWPTTFQLDPTIEDAAGNPWLGTATFTITAVANATPGAFSLTSVTNSASGTAVYAGTFASGGSNAYEGNVVTVSGYTGAAAVNNGTFLVTASTTAGLTLNNPNAVAVTAAGTVSFLQGTTVYTGTITGGAANAYKGLTAVVEGFTGANNNGAFIVLGSDSTTLTLANAAGTSASHAATITIQETLTPIASQLAGAAEYSLMGYAGITNTGATVISGGNIGAGTGSTAITGITGANLVAPSVVDNTNVAGAQTDLATAISYYQGLTPTLSGLSTLSSEGNGSTAATFTPGVYVGAAGLTMATGIILDALGNPNATFVFVAGTTINLASGQSVALVNGAQAANVVFVAGTSATTVATSTMNGSILAASSVTLGGGVLNGRALANTGAVTIAAATTVTTPATASSVFGNELTYVVYGERTVTGQTYIPSGANTPVATISQTGLLTAVARGQATAEVSFPAFNNSIPAIVSPGNIMNGLPLNKIYAEVNIQVGA